LAVLSLSLLFGNGMREDRLPLSRPRLRRLILATLPAGCTTAHITVVIVGAAEGKRLNAAFRKKSYATNVLTFDYSPPPDIAADVVLCHPVVQQEAKASRKPLDHHYAHLIVHGVLHACGLDHQNGADANRMEALEAAILRRFRIPDPYLH
jgi:probable rRNA maturation factor